MVAVVCASTEAAGRRYGTADRPWNTPLCAIFHTGGGISDMKTAALGVFETTKGAALGVFETTKAPTA